MNDWQQRVIDEKRELCERLAKLRQFFVTTAFAEMDSESRELMKRQAKIMQNYTNVLNERIKRFK